MNAQKDGDRAARFEELKFAKRQQWAVVTSALTLLGAIFAIAHNADPPLADWEKRIGSLFVIGVAAFGIVFLGSLQKHLRDTRRALDPNGADAWLRGGLVVASLMAIVLFSAIVVGWFLWR